MKINTIGSFDSSKNFIPDFAYSSFNLSISKISSGVHSIALFYKASSSIKSKAYFSLFLNFLFKIAVKSSSSLSFNPKILSIK